MADRSKADADAPGASDAGKVLIVEDNDLNMRLFCDVLEAFGIESLQTGSGPEAIKLARAHKPRLIIMDIQLADSSGIDITRALKADPELAPIPVLAVTAFAMKGDEKRIIEAGAEGYLSKPISVSSFMATVRRFLG